jgi:hypothetical protein
MFTVSDIGNISVLPPTRTKLAQRWDKCFFVAGSFANRSSVGTMIAELRDGPINDSLCILHNMQLDLLSLTHADGRGPRHCR